MSFLEWDWEALIELRFRNDAPANLAPETVAYAPVHPIIALALTGRAEVVARLAKRLIVLHFVKSVVFHYFAPFLDLLPTRCCQASFIRSRTTAERL